MRAVTLAAALLLASLARAEETLPAPASQPSPEAPAQPPDPPAAIAPAVAPGPAPAATAPAEPPPKPHILSEKEVVDDDGYKVRLSLPTEDDVAAWSQPGIRISLAYGYGRLLGRPPALDLTTHAFTIRAMTRIDRSWSIGLEYQYALARGTLTGLRYEGTLHAMLHPWRQLGVDVGVGFGGLVLTPPTGRPAQPGSGGEVSNVTFGPDTKLGACGGDGWVGLARAEYQFVAGSLFASGPYLELNAQYTRCEQTLGRLDRETGVSISARQWWLERGAALGWWVSWR